jgi:hypothetical protein
VSMSTVKKETTALEIAKDRNHKRMWEFNELLDNKMNWSAKMEKTKQNATKVCASGRLGRK